MKIVINNCHGGFSLSDEACHLYLDLKGIVHRREDGINSLMDGKFWTCTPEEQAEVEAQQAAWHSLSKEERIKANERYTAAVFLDRDLDRDDPILIEVVEKLGDKASGLVARLAIVEIPDDVEWTIEEYDGLEWIAEKHRTWGAPL